MSLLQPLLAWLYRLAPRLMLDLIRRQIATSVPFARLIGVSVLALHGRSASVELAEAAEVTNHVGTVHAGALFSACESASGAALAAALAPVIARLRFVVRDASINYLRPAQGRLEAHATLVDGEQDLLAALQDAGRANVLVEVAARAADETVVATASFRWSVKLAG